MAVCSTRRRKIGTNLLLLSLLSVAVCLTLLSCIQKDFQTENGLNQFETQLKKDFSQSSVLNNGHREILHYNKDYNNSQSVDVQSFKPIQTSIVTTEQVEVEPASCDGPWPSHPDCSEKMNWMEGNWQKDPCYAEMGVDGSKCSFQRYLSAVEHWCPLLLGAHLTEIHTSSKAEIKYNIQPLLDSWASNSKFDWIAKRILSLWPLWSDAIMQLQTIKSFKHTKKKILIHIGALSTKSGFKLAENAGNGGPLGELVQWSDLIATLHVLGHKMLFSTEQKQLGQYLPAQQLSKRGCPTGEEEEFDAIFTDIVGFKQFKKISKNNLQHYQCLFRVLDSFGTEPQFNFKSWKHKSSQPWGNLELNPRQFMTMYPHTPDNSFLGFVVGSNKTNSLPAPKKKGIGLVYGKELYMWKDHHDYLDIISKFLDIHATIGTTSLKNQDFDKSIVPGFVRNHGILSHEALTDLLKESRLFIGLGFPYEGPAPLEAIANGCYYLNPRFSPPLNADNTKFFKGKPTLRPLTSQNPYMDSFVGKPHVYSVDMQNLEDVESALREMLSRENPPPHIPYEYTHEGMIERVTIYLENQDFCHHTHTQWPPASALKTKISQEGESCKEACYREGLVCEPEFFNLLNNEQAMSMNSLQCSDTAAEHSLHGPSIHSSSNHCSFQVNPLLLSCVGSEANTKRLCPCRTFVKGQVALCSTCVR